MTRRPSLEIQEPERVGLGEPHLDAIGEPGAVRAPAERLEHPGLDVDRDDPAGRTASRARLSVKKPMPGGLRAPSSLRHVRPKQRERVLD
jgi:hypothetical protein